jgi:hypothetical protein
MLFIVVIADARNHEPEKPEILYVSVPKINFGNRTSLWFHYKNIRILFVNYKIGLEPIQKQTFYVSGLYGLITLPHY